jgi:hypothetical protein
MGIDYGDHVSVAYKKLNGKLYGAKEIERLIGKCADMGATAIYWRTANTGVVMYRSQMCGEKK